MGDATCDVENLTLVSTAQGAILGDANVVAAAARGLYNRKARSGLEEMLASANPARTVVHVHGWTKALSSSVFDAVLGAGFPLVVTLHEYFIVCPIGSLYLHGARAICRKRPLSLDCIACDCDSRNYAHKAYRVARQFVQRDYVGVPRRLKNLVTVSEFSRRVLAERMPGTPPIEVLRNPIAVDRSPRTAAVANRPYAYVGRLSAEKGATLFAAAAREASVEAVFVGDGEDRANITRINPDARVVGWVDHDAVLDHLRAARAVVLPSLWYETFGLVVLEGAALGIPAIVPASTAPSDLVDDGETGSWFARGNVDDLARALRVHEDDAVTERMSDKTYETYWANPATLEHHVDELTRIYETALQDFSVEAAAGSK